MRRSVSPSDRQNWQNSACGSPSENSKKPSAPQKACAANSRILRPDLGRANRPVKVGRRNVSRQAVELSGSLGNQTLSGAGPAVCDDITILMLLCVWWQPNREIRGLIDKRVTDNAASSEWWALGLISRFPDIAVKWVHAR